MIDLNEITVFNDIRERLAAVTDAQITAIERKLEKESDEDDDDEDAVIGVVQSKATRGLYTLSRILGAQHMLEHAKAACAEDPVIADEHEEKAVVVDILSDVARELFWAQAKVDLGFYEEENVGIRANWEVVRIPDRPNPHAIMRGMIGGS